MAFDWGIEAGLPPRRVEQNRKNENKKTSQRIGEVFYIGERLSVGGQAFFE